MAEQGREAVTQTDGLFSRLERIEAKLDALLEALDQEEDEATAVITTMDGERLELPTGADHL